MPDVQRWRSMIEAEHAQSDRAQGEMGRPADFWVPYAGQFAIDPHRTDDPLLDRLTRDLKPSNTLIDVGAGGGRYALPLALRFSHVVAVEPSESMCGVLRQQASQYGIGNVSVVQADWDEAQVEQADVVVCVHVIYTITDVAPFLRKMEAHARQYVMVVLYQVSPQAQVFPAWERIHGEPRLSLPAMLELKEVLQELEIPAHLETLPPNPPRTFESRQQALEQLVQRLYLEPGSPKMRLLEESLDDLLEEADGAYRLRGAPHLEPTLVWWEPATVPR